MTFPFNLLLFTSTSDLISTLASMTYIPNRSTDGAFVFAVDHCFALKGKGVILTGTCLQGRLAVGDNLEIPALKEVRKVKSMQMFKKPVDCVKQGRRLGLQRECPEKDNFHL